MKWKMKMLSAVLPLFVLGFNLMAAGASSSLDAAFVGIEGYASASGTGSRPATGGPPPEYNVAVGSRFEVSADDVEGITVFEKKPKVFVAVGSKKKAVKVLNKGKEFKSGSLDTISCEWKNKRVGDGTYTLMVQPKAKGYKYSAVTVTDSFAIEPPEITGLEQTGTNQFKLTGKYFGSKKPKLWLTYTDPEKKKSKKSKCKILKPLKYSDAKGKSGKSVMDVDTGDSEITFSIHKKLAPYIDQVMTGEIPVTLHLDNKVGTDTLSFEEQGGGDDDDTYSISGAVSGDVKSGVTMSLIEAPASLSAAFAGIESHLSDKKYTATVTTTFTDSNGDYEFDNLADGSYTVTPSLSGYSFSPSSRSVTLSGADSSGNNFTASDDSGGGGDDTNSDPTAADIAATTFEGEATTIPAIANCLDPDGDTLTIASVSSPMGGTASVSGDNVLYTPGVSFTGNDDFEYTISDGNGGSDTGTVSVFVSAVAEQASEEIGPDGGSVSDGSTTVTVAAGAVGSDTTISIINGSDSDGNPVIWLTADGAVNGEITVDLPELDGFASSAPRPFGYVKDLPKDHWNYQAWHSWDGYWWGDGRNDGTTTLARFNQDPVTYDPGLFSGEKTTGIGHISPQKSSILFGSEAPASVSLQYQGRIPVMLIHGYERDANESGDFGGGDNTWGDLATLLEAEYGDDIIVFEFSWRTNARFQDVANDLREALELTYAATGENAHLVCHSFGGILARTYLQGMALEKNDASLDYTPRAASLLTVGTPHSGIADAADQDDKGSYVAGLPKGQDSLTFGGRQISMHQMGEPVGFCSKLTGVFGTMADSGYMACELNRESGGAFARGFPASFKARVLIGMTTRRGSETIIGSKTDTGDFLISFDGQRFLPSLRDGEFFFNGTSCRGVTLTEQALGSAPGDTVIPGVDNPWTSSNDYGAYGNGYAHDSFHAGLCFARRETYIESGAESSHATYIAVTDWLDGFINGGGGENTPPVASGQSVSTAKNTAKSITLSATDADGDSLTYTIASNPSHGTLSGTAPDLTYTPTTDYTGSDSFSFYADDGTACSLTATVSITVTSGGTPVDGNYIVVDLSSGAVTELSSAPSDLLTNADYKSSKIVLRHIEAGSFTMGSPSDELGRDSDETQHSVTLSQDYYIGVFEVTQAQYQAVMGSNPSYFQEGTCSSEDSYGSLDAYRPVEQVSWNSVRGGTWPSGDPDSTSFMGKLQTLTGHNFDLPTEAQWEYACRAGTTTALNNGLELTTTTGHCMNLDPIAWFEDNADDGDWSEPHAEREGTQPVGGKTANSWGLYDMSGNVWEWCLDWYDTYPGTVTDPVGASSDSCRCKRGGSWINTAWCCRSASRNDDLPTPASYIIGFRVALPAGQ